MSAANPPSRQPTPSARKRLEVLIVDDSKAQRRLMSIHLNNAGFDVIEAGSGAEALELFKQRRPSIVLSDWVMPGMSGTDLCRWIRRSEGDDYCYFLLLTSKTEPADIAFGLESGADDFLTKPSSAMELRARLRAGERIINLQSRARRSNQRLTDAVGALRKAQAAMEKDLSEARRLQQGMIGARNDVFGSYSVSKLLRPAGHVGGDLVGSFAINQRRFGVFSIDVSGHGVAAALLTARLAAQFSASVDQNAALYIDDHGLFQSRSPSELARYLNYLMLSDLRTDSYFTMVFAIVDRPTGKVTLVQAGHPHPVVQRANGRLETVGKPGFPVGVIEEATFEDVTLQLDPGDRLLIASDGIWEAMDQNANPIGEHGLHDLMSLNRETRGESFLESLLWSVSNYIGGPADDDVSAVLVERGKLDL